MNNQLQFMLCILLLCIILLGLIYINTSRMKKESFTIEEETSIESESLDNPVPPAVSSISEYYEYPETYVEKEGGFNTDELYKGYEGPLKGKSSWQNMTLAQCQDACNSMSGCIGFSRNAVDASKEATCRPRSSLSQCHTNIKGDSSQRAFSSGYITYLKSNVPKQLTVCLGSESLTLNRMISIKSEAKPFHYVSIDSNTVLMKEFKTTGIDFIQMAKFLIVRGLENSNTVSFKMTDSQDIDYYIVAGQDNLEIKPINTDNSTLAQRTSASFELLDGFGNNYMVSIRTLEVGTATPRYWALSGESNIHKIMLVSLDSAKIKPKLATFDIVDVVSGVTILDKPKEASESFGDLQDATAVLNKISTNYKPILNPEQSSLDALDRQIATLRDTATESDVLRIAEEELNTWKQGVETYNTVIENQKTEIVGKINEINKATDKMQLADLAREYYFLRNHKGWRH